jgi:hypothetical protein
MYWRGSDDGAFLGKRASLRFVVGLGFENLELGETEIEHFNARFRRENVRRFEVATGDRFAMRGFERAGQLNCRLQRQIERQRILDFCTVDVLHDEIVGTDVVNLADVRMIQCRDGPGLALEALAKFFGRCFDGDDEV